MARGDTEFCRLETDVPVSEECQRLKTPGTKWAYLVLWSWAVVRRKCRLTADDVLTNCPPRAEVQRKSFRRMLAVMELAELIFIHANGDITVCGVRRKHKKLPWKDDGKDDPYGDHKGVDKGQDERPIRVKSQSQSKTKSKSPPNPPSKEPDNQEEEGLLKTGLTRNLEHVKKAVNKHWLALEKEASNDGPEMQSLFKCLIEDKELAAEKKKTLQYILVAKKKKKPPGNLIVLLTAAKWSPPDETHEEAGKVLRKWGLL